MRSISMRNSCCLTVLVCAVIAILDQGVEGFATRAPLQSACGHRHFCAARIPIGGVSPTVETRRYSSSMFFDFGKKKASGGRPVAGGTVKGGKKSKVVQEPSAAAKRQQAAAARSEAQRRNKKLEGVFTPEQFDAFQRARREVPSGSGQAYWNKIAARVPEQNAAACKGMAESLLFEKAVGTKSNYFGGYIDVKETPDYVDPDADIFVRVGKLFGKNKA